VPNCTQNLALAKMLTKSTQKFSLEDYLVIIIWKRSEINKETGALKSASTECCRVCCITARNTCPRQECGDFRLRASKDTCRIFKRRKTKHSIICETYTMPYCDMEPMTLSFR